MGRRKQAAVLCESNDKLMRWQVYYAGRCFGLQPRRCPTTGAKDDKYSECKANKATSHDGGVCWEARVVACTGVAVQRYSGAVA